ncbi:TPA: adhesin [Proteus mirabilis]|nr:adhesin [Proteus mirabilis]
MNYKNLFIISTLSIFSIAYSKMSLALTRYVVGGNGGYLINLSSMGAAINEVPSIGSDGNKYYLIGPNKQKITITQETALSYGTAKCFGNYLSGNYTNGLSQNLAYHRVISYTPKANFSINGLAVYIINSNTFFTLNSDNGITKGWQNIPAFICSDQGLGYENPSASLFTVQFPFDITFYVKNIPLDGKIIVPSSVIAGYTRVFQDDGLPNYYIPIDKSTVKLELANSVVSYPTSCNSNIDNLNIDHKTLDSTNFDNIATRVVSYNCNPPLSEIPIKFTLDYVTDADPLKRVPLKSGIQTIYSELKIYDEQTGQSGKSIETTISSMKNIRVESHISGTNVEPGVYSGNAWLIATYL